MKISILFGGVSYEHEISIVSAITLVNKIGKSLKVEHCIFLDQKHEFYLIEIKNMTSKYFSSMKYKKAKKLLIGPNGFYEKNILGKSKPISSSVLLNLIHGADGEDGVLTSLFDFFRIPFIGPRLEASVLSYNKHLTKMYARDRGVLVLDFVSYKKGNTLNISSDFPVIIKPSRLGSSIGVSVANNQMEVDYALDCAFEFDHEIIIEPFIKGVKEYNLAGAKVNNEYIFSIIEEPNKKDLLNFNDKYLDFSRASEIVGAKIPQSLENQIQNSFMKIYENKFEGALIRCDFFVINHKVYLNEINPIPGSMANYLFSDFESVLQQVASNLPKRNSIKVNYEYIEKIHSTKGK